MSSFVTLPNRGQIHIIGADAFDFLQGLITNNLERLNEDNLLYSCFLTPNGKFLFDFFVQQSADGLILDVEGGTRAQDFYAALKRYAFRVKLEFDLIENADVYTIFDSEGGRPDPRHPALGRRSFEKPELEEKPFADWDQIRIRHCIPDGSRDMQPERSTLIECNLERLGAIDFKKGCYMGQELTARMHYRGLAKKHLYAIENPKGLPEPDTAIEIGGKQVGVMRSSCGHVGIALLKDDALEALAQEGYTVIGRPERPSVKS